MMMFSLQMLFDEPTGELGSNLCDVCEGPRVFSVVPRDSDRSDGRAGSYITAVIVLGCVLYRHWLLCQHVLFMVVINGNEACGEQSLFPLNH